METIKEEKKADLEQLLNSLIEKGWEPFGKLNKLYVFENGKYILGRYDLRQIVSKESGLWQFVCENNLVEYDTESGWGEFSFRTDYINGFYGKHIFESNYQYRLIESSLKDESELEDFLLSNIKVEGEEQRHS